VPGRYQFSLPSRRIRDGWFRLSNLDVTTTALLVLLGAASMVWWAIDSMSLERLWFTGAQVRSGEVWRLVTWPIPNPPRDIWVVITLAFFWFVGHAIEDRIGRKQFTALLLATIVLPAAITTALGMNRVGVGGLSILGLGLLVVFALDNPNVPFFFGIPAWVIAAIYVALDVLRYVGERAYEALTLELLIIVVGLVSARQFGMVDQLTFIPRLTRQGSTASRPKRRPAKRSSGGSKVVSGPWAPPTAPTHSPADEAELNRLLDKINDVGIDGLNRDEKSRLNELSKKLRGR
jgi:membrane associated rhomboid family serine protease